MNLSSAINATSPNPESDNTETLILYVTAWCGFCTMVLRVIEKLGLEVEIRDIRSNPRYFQELFEARGRGTVPVLRRDRPDTGSDWMPESRHIIDYLIRTYGPRD